MIGFAHLSEVDNGTLSSLATVVCYHNVLGLGLGGFLSSGQLLLKGLHYIGLYSLALLLPLYALNGHRVNTTGGHRTAIFIYIGVVSVAFGL